MLYICINYQNRYFCPAFTPINEHLVMTKLIYVAGSCHGYMQQQGRTGGWQDCHCPHLFKLCSKMETIQESVADPSNILHSFKKRPICVVCDDACTLAEYEMLHYPEDSERCLGDRKGCFQKPDEHIMPSLGIDCKVREFVTNSFQLRTHSILHPIRPNRVTYLEINRDSHGMVLIQSLCLMLIFSGY